MNLKRIVAIAVGIWLLVLGLHYWLNSDRPPAGKQGPAAARSQFTVAYIPVT